ncbi:MAG TPA: hypothetical protein VJP85_00235 [Candidatus Baltobacteraceae bacterium]|nr:hypothetical protein [Candidatus Baltobacteraceae bacterium]
MSKTPKPFFNAIKHTVGAEHLFAGNRRALKASNDAPKCDHKNQRGTTYLSPHCPRCGTALTQPVDNNAESNGKKQVKK